jgi:hypothetical protein
MAFRIYLISSKGKRKRFSSVPPVAVGTFFGAARQPCGQKITVGQMQNPTVSKTGVNRNPDGLDIVFFKLRHISSGVTARVSS